MSARIAELSESRMTMSERVLWEGDGLRIKGRYIYDGRGKSISYIAHPILSAIRAMAKEIERLKELASDSHESEHFKIQECNELIKENKRLKAEAERLETIIHDKQKSRIPDRLKRPVRDLPWDGPGK
jgi:hypothetical protein